MISGRIFVHDYRPLTLIKVVGEDAFSFLQGQFTNELRQAEGSATYGLWLNQKGRVIADSQVLRLGDKEWQVMSVTSRAAEIQRRLESYIVADDVTLIDETATVCGLALGGPGCAAMIGEVIGAVPGTGHQVRRGEMLVLAGRRLPAESFEIIGPGKSLAELREKFVARGCVVRETEEMELARILAGIPAVPVDVGPGDLPNEGGLEESAISYTKGCYLGQEVMARLKNLGQVRRRLHLISGEGARPPALTPLYQGPRKAGEIRSAAVEGNGFVALAMLSLLNFNPETGLSFAPDGSPVLRLHPHG